MSKKFVIALFISVLCVSAGPAKALAVTVSPSRVELGVPPSKTYEGTLTIANSEAKDFSVNLRVEDRAKALGVKWFEIAPRDFSIGQNEIRSVKYKIGIPKGARGELSVMVFVESKPKDTQGSVSINTSIGIPIYVMVSGTEEFGAEVGDLTIRYNSPLELLVEIRNHGNVHIRPEGAITIKNKTGKEVMSVPLNEFQYPVLPKTARILEIRTGKKLDKGEYTADIKMKYADKTCEKKAQLTVE